jgi:hypothetical protein
MPVTSDSGDRPAGTEVVWTTAFLDLPPDVFDRGVAFWLAVTDGTLSARRGSDGQFATVVPRDGDAYLRVQRRPAGTAPRTHLDLHVVDVEAAAGLAESLGARRLHQNAHVVLVSPGGYVFCIVLDRGEVVRPAPRNGALVDQLCVDIPAERYGAECAFWAALTGWELRKDTPEEFHELVRPPGVPLRLLLQRLGERGGEVRAHLDLAAGRSRDAVVAQHVAYGAVVEGRRRGWVVLRDPGGLRYCVTARDPVTGI